MSLAVAMLMLMLTSLWMPSRAFAEGPLDPTDPKWNPNTGQEPGHFTLQGHEGEQTEAQPLVPFAVSAPATLLVAAGGLVLVIPEMSVQHVLGFKSGANKERAYLGMGLLCLAPAIGLGLSGGHWGDVVVGPLIEAGLIGLSFGLAWVTNASLNATNDPTTKLLIGEVIAYPLLGITIPVIAAAVLFPVLCAFLSGAELDREQERPPAPTTSVGLAPLPGGGIAGSFALRF